jgi:hypothetical protein
MAGNEQRSHHHQTLLLRRAANAGVPTCAEPQQPSSPNLGLIGLEEAPGDVRHPAVVAAGPSLSVQHQYAFMALSRSGRDLHDLMRLETISGGAIEQLWDSLEASVGRVSGFSGVERLATMPCGVGLPAHLEAVSRR